MAEQAHPQWSDKRLVVRLGGQVFVLPSQKLQEYRDTRLVGLGDAVVTELFARHREDQVEAALVQLVTIFNGDIAPPRPSRAPKG